MKNKGCMAYANSYIDTSGGNRYFLKNSYEEIALKMFDGSDSINVKIAIDGNSEEEKTLFKDDIHHYGRFGARR